MLLLKSMYVHVCFCVGMYMWVPIPMEAKQGIGSPEARVTGGRDQPDVGAGN